MTSMVPPGLQIRTLTEADRPELLSFLDQNAALSLPIRLKLERGGLVCHGDAHQAHYLAVMERNLVRSLLVLGTDGLVLVQCPEPDDLPLLVDTWKDWFDGEALGLVGPRSQIEELLLLMGYEQVPFRLNNTELVNVLALDKLPSELLAPELGARYASESDLETVVSWRLSWLQSSTHMQPSEQLATQIAHDLMHAISQNALMLLTENDYPVAMGQCIIRAGGTSQLGGFFVPEERRGQGLGTVMIDRLCRAEQAGGAQRCTILTIRRSASLAQSIGVLGFEPAGPMGLILFDPKISPRPSALPHHADEAE